MSIMSKKTFRWTIFYTEDLICLIICFAEDIYDNDDIYVYEKYEPKLIDKN